MPDLGWHVISGEGLLAMLRRVAAGEDPDMVYAEEYANADHEHVEADPDLIDEQADTIRRLCAEKEEYESNWRNAEREVRRYRERLKRMMGDAA